jgi:NAD(P) transhydrogenase subunit alpha
MIVGVPVQSGVGERRVSIVPAVVPMLSKAGLTTCVESGAGRDAGFPDDSYESQGATITADQAALFGQAEIVPLLHGPGNGRLNPDLFREKQVVVGLLDPLGDPEGARRLAERGVTSFALELLPRISRAQPMDALTSMATVAGYKSVLLAGEALDKMFPLMMTAAGTITPARVLVIGAGVAGLQAIANARRLGAVVSAYDVRPAVKEQVESLGARFLEVPLATGDAETSGGYAKAMDEEFYRSQREFMAKAVAESDVVITTAAIPGGKAPLLITADAVAGMRPGSVIVDLASESGGNCENTKPGETVDSGGVKILGPTNLAATVPHHASQMYARNVAAFLSHITADGALHLDLEDEITRESMLTHEGKVVNTRVLEKLGQS